MFNNLRELITSMPDEKTCRDYLVQQRWNGSPVCPYCSFTKCYVIEGGKRFKCGSKTCYKKFSCITGSVFEASNIPVCKWLTAVYISTAHKKGISSYQLGRDIGVSQKTAWFMLHRIREALRVKNSSAFTTEVQADETYIGGEEGNKHKSKKLSNTPEGYTNIKTPIIGLYEDGKVKTQVVPIVTKKVVVEIITKNIAKGAKLITDGGSHYITIGKKYDHTVVNHSAGQYRINGFHTNGIENFWSVLSRGIFGIYHHVSPKHLQRYCDEFSFRYNSRKIKDKNRFEIAMQNVEGRLRYKDLVENSLTSWSYGKDIETIQTEED